MGIIMKRFADILDLIFGPDGVTEKSNRPHKKLGLHNHLQGKLA